MEACADQYDRRVRIAVADVLAVVKVTTIRNIGSPSSAGAAALAVNKRASVAQAGGLAAVCSWTLRTVSDATLRIRPLRIGDLTDEKDGVRLLVTDQVEERVVEVTERRCAHRSYSHHCSGGSAPLRCLSHPRPQMLCGRRRRG